ncbi:MAG: hypothetical protein HY590_06150 [Candidatus Omnitrophica bacterium]|nr:hypothetical protein [Candidatus Omnitrophota bacterium]
MIRFTPFQNALLFSSSLHFLLLFGAGRFTFQGPSPFARESLELFYVQREEPNLVQPPLPEPPMAQKGLGLDEQDSLFSRKENSSQEEISSKETSSKREEEIRSEAEMIEALHLNHEEKPIFLTYYQEIRERIRKNLFAYYRSGRQEGNVTLNFVLFSNGQLKKVKAVEKEKPSHPALREIAMRSVIDASPFPPFPNGFKRPSASLWVRVTFVNDKVQRPGE